MTAFGAAANLVHPATGYSIARSLREAPNFAEEVATLLKKRQAVGDTAEGVWEALWPPEKRRQVCCARARDKSDALPSMQGMGCQLIKALSPSRD